MHCEQVQGSWQLHRVVCSIMVSSTWLKGVHVCMHVCSVCTACVRVWEGFQCFEEKVAICWDCKAQEHMLQLLSCNSTSLGITCCPRYTLAGALDDNPCNTAGCSGDKTVSVQP